MSYQDSKACEMVATHCCCCSRPLVDAKSVEIGIGPICRSKYGFDIDVDEESREKANKLVYKVACDPSHPEAVDHCKELHDLGFHVLASKVMSAVAAIQITMTDAEHPHGPGRLSVKTPYSPDVVEAMRCIRGRRWDKEGKVNTFPISSKADLWKMMQTFYKGRVVVGPKGPFTI